MKRNAWLQLPFDYHPDYIRFSFFIGTLNTMLPTVQCVPQPGSNFKDHPTAHRGGGVCADRQLCGELSAV